MLIVITGSSRVTPSYISPTGLHAGTQLPDELPVTFLPDHAAISQSDDDIEYNAGRTDGSCDFGSTPLGEELGDVRYSAVTIATNRLSPSICDETLTQGIGFMSPYKSPIETPTVAKISHVSFGLSSKTRHLRTADSASPPPSELLEKEFPCVSSATYLGMI